MEEDVKFTWRQIWVIRRKCHFGLEIPTIVERVRVDDDKSDIPVKDIVAV